MHTLLHSEPMLARVGVVAIEAGRRSLGVLILASLTLGCAAARAWSPSRVHEDHPSIVSGSQRAAEVYFVRESVTQSSWISLPIYLNDERIVLLRSGTYAALRVEPGEHSLGSPTPPPPPWHWDYGIANSPVQFQAGKTYFVTAVAVDPSRHGGFLRLSVSEFAGPGTPESELGEYKLIHDGSSRSVE